MSRVPHGVVPGFCSFDVRAPPSDLCRVSARESLRKHNDKLTGRAAQAYSNSTPQSKFCAIAVLALILLLA